MTWGQTSAGCPLIFTNHTNSVRVRVNSWTGTSVRAHLALGHLEGRGRGAERFRVATGGGAGFVSPAGRVRGRRRAAPSAFVVAAAGQQVAEGRALRANTKRRGAPFTKTRVRGTRKRLSRSSKHESASPLARILNFSICRGEGRRTTDFMDYHSFKLGKIRSVERQKRIPHRILIL